MRRKESSPVARGAQPALADAGPLRWARAGEPADRAGRLLQYTPMTPTLGREPFHRDGRVYEEKVDGWRMLAYKDDERSAC